uniref:Ras-GEF domain-containing protein n=1 Tax=Glossina brevipalpis TaxID=37001 RepID=A0A1A9WQS3_9MUSC
MMRYSEIARELSADNLRFVELTDTDYSLHGTGDSSPISDASNGSGPFVNQSPAINSICRRHRHQSQQQCQSTRNSYLGRRRSKRHTLGYDDVNDVNCDDDDDDIDNSDVDGTRKSLNDDNLSLGGHKNNFSALCAGLRNSKRFSSTASNVNDRIVDGAATIAYVRQRKDSNNSTQSCNYLADSESIGPQCSSKSLNIKNSRRKNSIGCLTAFSSSPDSPGNYYGVSSKSHSLPGHSSNKPSADTLDSTILNALRVPADELANQLTLLDFNVFAAIQPDELTSCAWTKKDKHSVTPNIVAFTKRFNHTSFWTVQEILSGEQPKQRAEILAHFIKVAKKLHELNNLHSLFAIISGMQSASIYRLKKTWSCLAKKDKHCYERLSDIFSDQNNWENLRSYLESLRLPCIPYLGLFLTDLIFIDLAFPHKGGLEPEQRRNRMNNILRVIANYQQSNYTYIQAKTTTQKYLNSIRYIEELQNIFEEDQYKKSLKLEPASPMAPSSSSCSSKESCNAEMVTPALACLSLSPAKTIGSVRVTSGSAANKFIPGHRKCRSLGTNIFGKASANDASSNAFTPDHNQSLLSHQPSRHLLDDSVLETNCIVADASIPLNLSESVDKLSCHLLENEALNLLNTQTNGLQGCVRRKTVQKEGRKPAVASWQRYWLQIWANSLVYFPPKSFKGSERNDFKREPCKVCPLDGWYAQIVNNPKHKNSFELYNRAWGTIYKFRTDSPQTTQLWIRTICHLAVHKTKPKSQPVNLMSFE